MNYFLIYDSLVFNLKFQSHIEDKKQLLENEYQFFSLIDKEEVLINMCANYHTAKSIFFNKKFKNALKDLIKLYPLDIQSTLLLDKAILDTIKIIIDPIFKKENNLTSYFLLIGYLKQNKVQFDEKDFLEFLGSLDLKNIDAVQEIKNYLSSRQQEQQLAPGSILKKPRSFSWQTVSRELIPRNLHINYQPTGITHQQAQHYLLYLSEKKWKDMIYFFIQSLNSKPIGRLIWNYLIDYLNIGYRLEITNSERNRRSFYPHAIRDPPTLIIPYTPYFKYSQSKINDQTVRIPAYPFITFAHELIHLLRGFERFSDENQQNSTVGFEEPVLVLDGQEISENSIRKEWGLPPRLTYNDHEIYLILSNHIESHPENRTKFTQQSYTSIPW
jgi:hypothetical protein